MDNHDSILEELRAIRALLEEIRDQSAPQPRFLSTEQAAQILGVPVSTVKRVARETGISTRLERNRFAFTREDLDELAEAIAKPQSRRPPWLAPGEIDAFA
ncbi:MAG: helix-turn-helix domain-containing protein [Arthrobacter sp.]|jgi:excisionase family DNA binding protein|nr:helix-turn-helix domain-containing protein [Arthrobacter sp.]